ncbi:MAG TPA: hypothetical protein ENJ95_06185 [Bacteroidetes bacterium]|nr:hypothetical protein [Bacteroidota bacterium]
MPKKWFKIALLNLFIAMCLGLLMRYAFVNEVGWMKFMNILHAHSHVAMLGWAYLAIYAILIKSFLPEAKQKKPFYNRLFWATQISVIGMLATFPVQGYAAGSIAFSSLHGICSYLFVWQFIKDIKGQNSISAKLVRLSLFFMVLSTLALWAIPPIILNGMQGKAIYYAAVQFYLHFQFNGWFIFSVLGIFFKYLEDNKINYPKKTANIFILLLTISCLLTYVLAVTWSTPIPILFWINSLGVTIQLAALVFFLKTITPLRHEIKPLFSKKVFILMEVAFFAFAFKISMQTIVAVPYLATVAYTIRNFVIGFIHLILLGVITHFLLGFGVIKEFMFLRKKYVQIGVPIFMVGFVLSEAVLFLQGAMFWGTMGFIPDYYELLFLVSALMPIGMLTVVWGLIKEKNTI